MFVSHIQNNGELLFFYVHSAPPSTKVFTSSAPLLLGNENGKANIACFRVRVYFVPIQFMCWKGEGRMTLKQHYYELIEEK